jgi:hypothetical protein
MRHVAFGGSPGVPGAESADHVSAGVTLTAALDSKCRKRYSVILVGPFNEEFLYRMCIFNSDSNVACGFGGRNRCWSGHRLDCVLSVTITSFGGVH